MITSWTLKKLPPPPAGSPPFNADTPEEIFDNILDRNIEWPEDPMPTGDEDEEEEEGMSPECRDLIDRLLTPNPKNRLGHRGAGRGQGLRRHGGL